MANNMLPCLLRRSALAQPAAIAVRYGSKSITYRDLDSLVCEVERRLVDLGVHDLDTVAILADNSQAYVATVLALYRLGAVAVPLNQRWPTELLQESVARSECVLLLVDRRHGNVGAQLGVKSQLIDDLICKSPGKHDLSGHDSPIEIQAHRVITVVFTSGSSATPKGVLLTYGNHYYNALASHENIKFDVGDCWLASLPFCHVGGMAVLFRAALSGGSICLSSGWNTDDASEQVDRGEVSHVSVVPPMLDALVRVRSGRPFPPTLKAILVGGAPAPDEILKSAASLSAPIRTSYGMTEAASQICTLPAESRQEKLSSAGLPLACCEVVVLGEDGSEVPAGVAGEVAIRGRSVFIGYVGVDRDRTFDRDGWFLTGDVGEKDPDGFLYIRGRKDEMIISGGENIYPEQIEAVVSALPGIAECAIVGMDHHRWGKRPVLYYTVVPGLTPSEDELRQSLVRRLTGLFLPDDMIQLDSMPRTAIGKIDRAVLRAAYRESGSS